MSFIAILCCTVFHAKRVECAIFHLLINISGILHARPTYDTQASLHIRARTHTNTLHATTYMYALSNTPIHVKPSAVLSKSTGSGTRVVWDTSDSIPTASSPTEGQHEIQTVLPSVELPTPDFTIPPAQDGTTGISTLHVHIMCSYSTMCVPPNQLCMMLESKLNLCKNVW